MLIHRLYKSMAIDPTIPLSLSPGHTLPLCLMCQGWIIMLNHWSTSAICSSVNTGAPCHIRHRKNNMREKTTHQLTLRCKLREIFWELEINARWWCYTTVRAPRTRPHWPKRCRRVWSLTREIFVSPLQIEHGPCLPLWSHRTWRTGCRHD